jgi:MFS family permease
MRVGAAVSVLWPGALAVYASGPPLPVLYSLMTVSGAGIGLFAVLWETALAQRIPPHLLSRVSAWDWMGSFLFLPLGLVAAGPVSDLIGISATLWISVAWAVLSTLVVVLVPSVRDLRRPDVPEKPQEAVARRPGEPAEAFHGG